MGNSTTSQEEWKMNIQYRVLRKDADAKLAIRQSLTDHQEEIDAAFREEELRRQHDEIVRRERELAEWDRVCRDDYEALMQDSLAPDWGKPSFGRFLERRARKQA